MMCFSRAFVDNNIAVAFDTPLLIQRAFSASSATVICCHVLLSQP